MIKIVLLNEGLNRARNLVYDDIDKGQGGTGTTAPNASQTDLVSPITASLLNIEKTSSERLIKFDYTLPSTSTVTATYTEFKLNSSGSSTDYNRIIFTGISFVPNGGEDVIISQRLFFQGL